MSVLKEYWPDSVTARRSYRVDDFVNDFVIQGPGFH